MAVTHRWTGLALTAALTLAVATGGGVQLVSAQEPPPAAAGGPGKVVFDTDMGRLNDDAITLFEVLKARAEVLGVTTVAGNTWVEEGTSHALRQLELIGRSDVPVHQGAGEPLNGSRQDRLAAEAALFGPSWYVGSWDHPRPRPDPLRRPAGLDAADFIAEQVKRYPHQVTLFALGPLTNIALAVREHPEIVPLVKEVIYMGGAVDVPGNTTPAAEFNIWYDPEAAKIAFGTPFPRQTLVPLDATNGVLWSKAEYDRVVAGPSTPVKEEFKAVQGPLFQQDPGRKEMVFDEIVGGIFLDRGLVTRSEERLLAVDTAYGLDYGRTLGFTGAKGPLGTQKVQVVLGVDGKRFLDLLVGQLRRP